MALTDWHPTPAEVAAIVDEMRPIIRAHAERCARTLNDCTRSARVGVQSSLAMP